MDHGDTAWMLVSTGLVLLMVPGLALFYGGMVRRKNVLGTMMHSMVALAIIGIQWVLFGYCPGLRRHPRRLHRLEHQFPRPATASCPDASFPARNIPIFVHCMYQGMFAIITPALISGAVAERIRFGPYCLFILLWAIAGLRSAGSLGLGGRGGRRPGQPGDERGRRLAGTHGRPRLRRRHGGPHLRPALSGLAAILVLAQATSAIPSTPCTPTAWC